MKILYYVQSSLGIGHLSRSLKIIKQLPGQTYLINGSTITNHELSDNIKEYRLPSFECVSDLTFKQYTDKEKIQIYNHRRKILTDIIYFNTFDLIIFEMYPFGLRLFRDEIRFILDTNKMKKRPAKIISSVRDILLHIQPPHSSTNSIPNIIHNYFDKILVHSDERYIPLELTYPDVDKIYHKLYYTGYISEHIFRTNNKDSVPTIVTSIGGSNCGIDLLHLTIEMSKLLILEFPHKLKIYTGSNISDPNWNILTDKINGHSHIFLNKYSTNFISDLKNAQLSINMGGYNTIVELLQLKIPSIVYPFPQNYEQNLRISKLNICHQFHILNKDNFTVQALKETVLCNLNNSININHDINLNGIQNTINYITKLI